MDRLNTACPIEYQFNSLGYRTHEKFTGKEILAVGDSFTVGLGINYEHTWPYQLEQKLNYPVANFSLNGASNDWIARKLEQLLSVFDPPAVIVHYTFSHRRERPQTDWYDDERTECEPFYSDQENFNNWVKNCQHIISHGIPVVHSFIPNWHPVQLDLQKYCSPIIPLIQIDYGRDQFHYGRKTCDKFTNLLVSELHQFLPWDCTPDNDH
jgi:hypothetical protein